MGDILFNVQISENPVVVDLSWLESFLGLIPLGIQADLNSYLDKENFVLFSRKDVGIFPYSVSDHVKEDKKETDHGGQLMYKDNKLRKGDKAQILHKSGKNSKMGAMLVVKKNLFKLRKEKVTKEALGRGDVDKGKRRKVRETKSFYFGSECFRGPTDLSQFERNGVISNRVGGNSHEELVRESSLVPIFVKFLDNAVGLPMVPSCILKKRSMRKKLVYTEESQHGN
ncbi:hypothetical protein LWI28_013894 [Acer negundo]|uniref:Uncharacterized protein n=1 Tax=Acer negundo TaxID=4023 RepID=A0AAD5J682_ACENE|nr:hypothetical protein LWI28_013894 [Acer negundo]